MSHASRNRLSAQGAIGPPVGDVWPTSARLRLPARRRYQRASAGPRSGLNGPWSLSAATPEGLGCRVTITKPPTPSDDKRWRAVDARMLRLGYSPDALIEVLHTTQQSFGYLDDVALTYVGETLGVPLSKVYGVATFYSLFTLKPQGEHTCVVCTGTACHINGASAILAAIRAKFGIGPKDTTPDDRISLVTARCLGACSIAPAVVFDGEAKGKQTPAAVVATLEAL
jgi:bidirectional [NiFe] hydrogenase diaphorase subunit